MCCCWSGEKLDLCLRCGVLLFWPDDLILLLGLSTLLFSITLLSVWAILFVIHMTLTFPSLSLISIFKYLHFKQNHLHTTLLWLWPFPATNLSPLAFLSQSCFLKQKLTIPKKTSTILPFFGYSVSLSALINAWNVRLATRCQGLPTQLPKPLI